MTIEYGIIVCLYTITILFVIICYVYSTLLIHSLNLLCVILDSSVIWWW